VPQVISNLMMMEAIDVELKKGFLDYDVDPTLDLLLKLRS